MIRHRPRPARPPFEDQEPAVHEQMARAADARPDDHSSPSVIFEVDPDSIVSTTWESLIPTPTPPPIPSHATARVSVRASGFNWRWAAAGVVAAVVLGLGTLVLASLARHPSDAKTIVKHAEQFAAVQVQSPPGHIVVAPIAVANADPAPLSLLATATPPVAAPSGPAPAPAATSAVISPAAMVDARIACTPPVAGIPAARRDSRTGTHVESDSIKRGGRARRRVRDGDGAERPVEEHVADDNILQPSVDLSGASTGAPAGPVSVSRPVGRSTSRRIDETDPFAP